LLSQLEFGFGHLGRLVDGRDQALTRVIRVALFFNFALVDAHEVVDALLSLLVLREVSVWGARRRLPIAQAVLILWRCLRVASEGFLRGRHAISVVTHATLSHLDALIDCDWLALGAGGDHSWQGALPGRHRDALLRLSLSLPTIIHEDCCVVGRQICRLDENAAFPRHTSRDIWLRLS